MERNCPSPCKQKGVIHQGGGEKMGRCSHKSSGIVFGFRFFPRIMRCCLYIKIRSLRTCGITSKRINLKSNTSVILYQHFLFSLCMSVCEQTNYCCPKLKILNLFRAHNLRTVETSLSRELGI